MYQITYFPISCNFHLLKGLNKPVQYYKSYKKAVKFQWLLLDALLSRRNHSVEPVKALERKLPLLSHPNVRNYKRIPAKVDSFVHNYFPKQFLFLWDHPAGLKTIFFWAPLAKWGLVVAGLGDILQRDPHFVSIDQSAILMTTGFIWTRYSLVITPKNWNLFLVNFFVAMTQMFELNKACRAQLEFFNPKR